MATKHPIILFEGESWEFTLRELVFSFLIIGVLVVIGYLIADTIERHVHSSRLKYKQAMQIEKDAAQFAWAINTDVGDVFVEGSLKTINPVSHPKLDGKWMHIDAAYQKYQMHTRTVTYTTTVNGKPRTRTRTETYWSWDTFKRESLSATNALFLGVNIPINKFDFCSTPSKKHIIKTEHHRRIVFNCIPTTFNGTLFTTINKKTITDKSPFYCWWNLKTTYDYYVESHAVVIFWIFWSLLIVLILVIYVIAENSWLEDN